MAAAVCMATGCIKPTYDGNAGYCSKTCRKSSKRRAAGFAPCAGAQSGCPCPASFDGQPESFCCKSCQGGRPCQTASHMTPSNPGPPASLAAATSFSRCARPGCCCAASYDGLPGSYCCKSCRKGQPCNRNVHTVPQVQIAPGADSGATNLCASGCGQKSWNGKAGEFCGRTCRQRYSQQLPIVQLKNYGGIKAQADLWRGRVWPQALGRGVFYANRGLGDTSCPAVRKFEAGLAALGVTDSSKSEFAWHGTSTVANVKSICWDNLDPQKRSGQAHGPGEYFSTDANVSNSYAGSSGYMILFLLLQGPHNTSHNVSYRVIHNPTHGKSMYCLPVGVVDYRSCGDPQLKGAGNF
ncbi:unnamed protein product [Effrenium voratum]|uniref:PARP catalytic domain-containing protein n=1 Tax=Effrenium voratum TaxID=2562239 RepID=A0AA36IGD9_9DINO|nr:unnamed protein product [Effrenium voratum]